ncbi:MAG TPA: NAD(P)-dependent oxidoreductase [Solirubrobacteraceae bacterium]
MRVAVLGTGIMGSAMARNLARAGCEVRAWNRSRSRPEGLAADGVAVCDTAAEAIGDVDVVITMLADGPAVEAVMEPLAGDLGAAVWSQMSTVGVAAIERLAALAERAGATMVDAPVLGTKEPAEAGALTVLASGPAAARERCQPVYDVVGSRTVALGDTVGTASRMKLVLNAWILALVEGLAESILLAEGLGLAPQLFLDILDGGPLDSAYVKIKAPLMVGRTYPASFPLRLAHKDAVLAIDAAADAGLELPLLDVVEERMRAAIEAGHGDEDLAATIEAGRLKAVRA